MVSDIKEVFMKKIFSWSILVLTLLAVSCGTIQMFKDVPPYNYTGEKAIYPAVHHAIVNGSKTAWENSKTTLKDPNTIEVQNVLTSEGLALVNFTLTVSLVNGVVTYKFSDIKTKAVGDSTWTRAERLRSSTESIFTSYFNTEIPKVMENEDLYAAAKTAADSVLAAVADSALGTGEIKYSFSLQNPNNYFLYPAVSATVERLAQVLCSKTAYLGNINVLNNTFSIRRCIASRGEFDLVEYRINISYQDDQLVVELTDMEKGNIMLFSDAEMKALAKFEPQRIAEQIKTEIERVLTNATAYSTAKAAFIANNSHLRWAFSGITRAMMDEFAQELFMGAEITLNVRVIDVKTNTNAEFSRYATEVTAGLFPDNSATPFATISLYTSDPGYARMSRGQNKISGQFVRMGSNALGPVLIMTK